MTKAIVQTYDVISDNVMRISFTLFVACFFFAILYVVNVFSVISKTVALQSVEAKISALGSDVDSLDAQYLALSGKITPDNLNAHGMSQGNVSEYIAKADASHLGIAKNFNHVAISAHGF